MILPWCCRYCYFSKYYHHIKFYKVLSNPWCAKCRWKHKPVVFLSYFRRYLTYADTCGNNGLTCLISYEKRNPSTVLMDELYIRKVFMSSTGWKRSLFSFLDNCNVSRSVIVSTCAAIYHILNLSKHLRQTKKKNDFLSNICCLDINWFIIK